MMGEYVGIVSGVVATLSAILGLVYHAGRTSKRIDGHSDALKKHDSRITTLEAAKQETDVKLAERLTAIDERQRATLETVKRVELSVDAIQREGCSCSCETHGVRR